MRKIIIGNWKQNPAKFLEAKKIATDSRKLTAKLSCDVVICTPLPFLNAVPVSPKFALGAQDVSVQKEGAHTGEVSAVQLRSVGVSYVIVGHSERRALGETSEIVSAKARAILKNKMSPVVCIGEKERGHDGEHWGVISRELHASLSGITKSEIKRVIVAYEPLWAIGSKSAGAMNPEDVSESAIFIRKVLAEMYSSRTAHDIRVVYGGSVDPKNAPEIAAASGVSGFLVGRQSLTAKNFAKIAEALK